MTYKVQSGKQASHLATAVHAILPKPRPCRRCLKGSYFSRIGDLMTISAEPVNRSPAAERMRRHRERRRDGLRCLTIELRETERDALISKGLLKADARNDLRAIREALYAYLDRTLGAGP
jgi:hypothetical protein